MKQALLCIFDCQKSIIENIYFLASIGTTVITFILLIYARSQLKSILLARESEAKINQENTNINAAKFYYKLKNDFFTEGTRELIRLFEHKLLLFKSLKSRSDDFTYYFEVDKDRLLLINSEIELVKPSKLIFTSNEVDDLLLGHLEDLGVLFYQKIISKELIYDGYEYYISEIGDNDQIQAYVCAIRKEKNDEDYYEKFEKLFVEFNPSKQKGFNCEK
jgi:hypothetical protein